MSPIGSSLTLTRLLQLASPLLPVGAYAYSQGVERAVHDGLVHDAASAERWILDQLGGPMATFDAPVWLRLHRAALSGDSDAFDRWNARYLASRESCELRAETLQMAASLRALACDLPIAPARRLLESRASLTFPAAFAACAHGVGLDERDGLAAYLWSWLENQVAAALKAVPLGQLAGQRLLFASHAALDATVAAALVIPDDELRSSAPGLALASALHEIQYSRLFRS